MLDRVALINMMVLRILEILIVIFGLVLLAIITDSRYPRTIELDMSYIPSPSPSDDVSWMYRPTQDILDENIASCKRDYQCATLGEAGYYEARGESDVGVVGVMHVVVNRVEDPRRWKSTIRGVVYQHKQFSYTHDGSKNRGMTEREQSDRMYLFAHDVLGGDIDSPVGRATHYHADYARPDWATGDTYAMHVGRHIFYY